MTEIYEKIRSLIGDMLKTDGVDSFTFESLTSSKIFTLTESNISSSTIIVYKNGSVWALSNYSYSTTTGKLTVTGTLVAGDSLEMTYSYYAKYSDGELLGFIRGALAYLSVERYATFSIKGDEAIFPTPEECEENLIALIATILIKGDVTSYRTPDLTISFEKSDSKEKKIKKFINQFSKSTGSFNYIDLTAVMTDPEEERDL